MTALDVMPIRLRLPGIKVTAVLREDLDALEVGVETIQATIRCKDCGRKTRSVHQRIPTKVRDLPVLGRPTTLVWARRRFICRACGNRPPPRPTLSLRDISAFACAERW